jgi:hypothetical protein
MTSGYGFETHDGYGIGDEVVEHGHLGMGSGGVYGDGQGSYWMETGCGHNSDKDGTGTGYGEFWGESDTWFEGDGFGSEDYVFDHWDYKEFEDGVNSTGRPMLDN